MYMRTLFVFLLTITVMSIPVKMSAQNAENIFTYRAGLFEITLLSESQGQGNKGILIGATPEMLQKYARRVLSLIGNSVSNRDIVYTCHYICFDTEKIVDRDLCVQLGLNSFPSGIS
jgi:hypothetical protein